MSRNDDGAIAVRLDDPPRLRVPHFRRIELPFPGARSVFAWVCYSVSGGETLYGMGDTMREACAAWRKGNAGRAP